MMTLFFGLLLYTAPAFSELTSGTDSNLPSSAAGMWKEHADPLYILWMGLLVLITLLYIAVQIVNELNRRRLEVHNQKIASLHKQIKYIQQEIEKLNQERTV